MRLVRGLKICFEAPAWFEGSYSSRCAELWERWRERMTRWRLWVVLTFLIWSGVAVTPAADASTERFDLPDARSAREALVNVTHETDPDIVYQAFNEFARTHFGAEAEPLVYDLFGGELTVIEESAWRHVSENSASLAWETNLPATTFVEYGPTPDYGMTTQPTDRPYYQHLHYLRGLEPGKTYHYRLVAVDERGNRMVTDDQSLTTARVDGAVYIPGELSGPPYRLEGSNVTYVLTEDVHADGQAFVFAGSNIVIDLNGHVVTFAENPGATGTNVGLSVIGNTREGGPNAQGVRVVNGTIVQGRSEAAQNNFANDKFNCLSIQGADVEIAGVTCEYHVPQAWGVVLTNSAGAMKVHHNVFVDKGTGIVDRHGQGVRPLGFLSARDTQNRFEIYNNLVKRTRQNGLPLATAIYRNEVYVDSWSINSFAIQPLSIEGVSAGRYHDNKVFATGFNAYGFGWAHEDLEIYDNFVHMHGLDVFHRWHERWGDNNTLSAMRVTNYDQGGQVRNNLRYTRNTIVLRGHDDSELRGVQFFSDETIAGLVFENNHVKVEALDERTKRAAAVNVQGHYHKPQSLPVVYIDNVFEGNNILIRFGDAYGIGHNHHFIRPRFVKSGDNPDFHTFVFDGGQYSKGHLILDAEFGPGTAYNDVHWQNTKSESSYSIAWTLDLVTMPGASVTIRDNKGNVSFEGIAGDGGRIEVPLIMSTIRPTEWNPMGFELLVLWKDRHMEERFTPYTVSVVSGDIALEREVDMVEKTSLVLLP